MKKLRVTKALINYCKFCVIVGCIGLCLLIILPISFSIFKVPNKIAVPICYANLFLSMYHGFIIAIIPFITDDSGNILKSYDDPLRYKVDFSCYESFSVFVGNALEEDGYALTRKEGEDVFEQSVFVKKKEGGRVKILQLISTVELTKEVLEKTNRVFKQLVEARYPKCKKSVITVVAVKRVNALFKRFIFNGSWQDLGFIRFIGGISFGSKTLYLPKGFGGYGLIPYKASKRYLLRLVGIDGKHWQGKAGNNQSPRES